MGEAAFCEFRQRLADAQCRIHLEDDHVANSQMLRAALIAAMLFTAPAFAAQDSCPAKVLAALDKLGIKRASADNAPEMQYFVPHDFGAGSLNLHCVGKTPEIEMGDNFTSLGVHRPLP
jgi:hypothetical protein